MAGFGLVLGGAADGFQKGVKLARDYEDTKRQQEILQGQREAEAIVSAIPLPGAEVAPQWTPDQAVNDALAKAKPRPDPVQRMASAAMKVLRPRDAAMAAGVTPAVGAGPTDATAAAPAQGTQPPADLSGVTVTAAGPRPISDVDRARLMLAAASRLKGPDGVAKVQEAWQNLHAIETEAFKQDVASASIRGPYALANMLEKKTNHQFDLTPVDGQPGVYKVAVDGEDTGQPMTVAQMQDAVAAMAMKDPTYPLQASIARSKEARAGREEAFDEKYKTGMLKVQQARASVDAQLAAAQAQHLGAETEQTRAQTQQFLDEKNSLNAFEGMLHDKGGAGDALLNEQTLGQLAAGAPIHMKGMVTSHVITDPNTQEQHVVTTNYADQLAQAAIQSAKQRYAASPFVRQGVVYVAKNPTGQGPSRIYAVKGAGGGFTNFDEAELAARRLYPKIEQAAAKPAKK